MRLPLFPLSIVLYPGEVMRLHIFEARYRSLTARCLEDDTPFGVLYMDEGKMAEVGCTARIDQVLQRYTDGRLDIKIKGGERFEVAKVYDNRAYLTGDVHYLTDTIRVPDTDAVERVIAQHMRLLELAGRKIRPDVYHQTELVSYLIARTAGLTLVQKQAVLEIPSEFARIAYLILHFNEFIPRIEEAAALRKKIQSNGHLESGDL